MEIITKLYAQILDLIRNLLITFGAETDVVDGLIADLNKEEKGE